MGWEVEIGEKEGRLCDLIGLKTELLDQPWSLVDLSPTIVPVEWVIFLEKPGCPSLTTTTHFIGRKESQDRSLEEVGINNPLLSA